ncbi:MAG: HPF/RaiA family ribosome-associated protein, partial [Alphaproteobacteria bacterium]|nr:HPF/RaiA family ribosome-associated protein [Alphaproteobacteria bacterium]
MGDVLQSYVDERLQSRITNNFSNSMDVNVAFSKEGHDSCTELLAHVGPCINTQARPDSSDSYATFDKASDRLEIWLHRYKSRLQDKHGHERPASEGSVAQNFVPA